jgi:hypothetical protein
LRIYLNGLYATLADDTAAVNDERKWKISTEKNTAEEIEVTSLQKITLILTIILSLALGVFPEYLIRLI